MKAAVLTRPGTIETLDIPQPNAGPGEVLVNVAYCGICGSDVPRVLQGAAHSYPIVLGHEFSGKVVATGEGVSQSLLGQRVAGIPLVPCGSCDACQSGDYALCGSYSFVGSRQQGAFAEYVALPAANVFPITDRTAYDQAAFFEPASVAQHAIDLMDFQPGSTAVVSGCGTIGIFTAQILKSLGASAVVALARRESRIEAARAAGIQHVCNTSEEGWKDLLLASLGIEGFDYVFDTSGNNTMMVEAFSLAGNKGSVCMVGTPKNPMTFTVNEWELLNRRELTVRGSWMSYGDPFPGKAWDGVAERFDRGDLLVVPEMIDTLYAIDEMPDGFKRFEQPASISGKLLMKNDLFE